MRKLAGRFWTTTLPLQRDQRDDLQMGNASFFMSLVRRDFSLQYRGSALGYFWVYFQPLLLMGVLYLVFSFGFRAREVEGVPFGVYLLSGLVSWNFLASTIQASSASFRGYSFLIKKVDFNLGVLPVVKLVSALLPHLFLLVVVFALAWFNGYRPSPLALQLLYYLPATMALCLGVSWLTASIAVFLRDVENIVQISLQLGFWLTPIFWHLSYFPESMRGYFELNPALHLVEGYRDAVFGSDVFWRDTQQLIYFWSVTLILLVLGRVVYARLRPHFAEVI